MIRLPRQILMALCLLPIACSGARQTFLSVISPMETVRRYCGKDLRGIREDERQSLKEAVERIRSGVEPDRHGLAFEPRYVWEYDSGTENSGCLMLECEPNSQETETTSIRLIWFDPGGTVRAEVEFSTGDHCFLKDASLLVTEGFQYPLIVLDTDCHGVQETDFARQYYAVVENRIDLVRLQGHDSHARRNLYYANHLACGPPPAEQTAEQWEADLSSTDRARVLRALVWLAGKHGAGASSESPHPAIAEPPQSELARTVRANAAVVRRIRELAGSGQEWERQQAALVSR